VTDESDRSEQRPYKITVVNRDPRLDESFWQRELPRLSVDICNVLHKINLKCAEKYERLMRVVRGLFKTQWFQSVVYRDGRIFCVRRRGQLVISFSLAEVKFLKLQTRHRRDLILASAH
jgi:hypothetical protein